eukprot:COSAG06_NODE_1205_length_10274_cov_36.044816_9_plen_72_part_00
MGVSTRMAMRLVAYDVGKWESHWRDTLKLVGRIGAQGVSTLSMAETTRSLRGETLLKESHRAPGLLGGPQP